MTMHIGSNHFVQLGDRTRFAYFLSGIKKPTIINGLLDSGLIDNRNDGNYFSISAYASINILPRIYILVLYGCVTEHVLFLSRIYQLLSFNKHTTTHFHACIVWLRDRIRSVHITHLSAIKLQQTFFHAFPYVEHGRTSYSNTIVRRAC